MLLGLASGNTFLDIAGQSATGTISTVSADIANVAKQAFYDFGERPMWAERVTYGTSECFSGFWLFTWNVDHTSVLSGDGSGTATFSGRRDGFALYFARLVRPLWKSKLTKPGLVVPFMVASTPILTWMGFIQRAWFATVQYCG
jgi:nuclear pore complex protein Nup155